MIISIPEPDDDDEPECEFHSRGSIIYIFDGDSTTIIGLTDDSEPFVDEDEDDE